MSVPFVDMHRLHVADREELIAAFSRVLDSGGFVQGREVAAFEDMFAPVAGCDHAVALNSGTAALHLALLAFGVGDGDEVITVANTFFATAEAISLTGATPVFVDIAHGTHLIDPVEVERTITSRTKAIIAVHLYGQMAPMDRLQQIARAHGLVLIEDAAQAHGALLDGRPAGSWGDAACFSFYPTKNLGAIGEGGAVTTKDPGVAARVRELRDHGQDAKHHHRVVGLNYRMAELQAAGLRISIGHLFNWNHSRMAAANWYREGLRGAGVELPDTPGDRSHVYHLFVVRHPARDVLAAHLASKGIGAAVHYPVPVHRQPAYAGLAVRRLPRTEAAVREILSLPMHPNITHDEVMEVCAAIAEFSRATDPGIDALVEVA